MWGHGLLGRCVLRTTRPRNEVKNLYSKYVLVLRRVRIDSRGTSPYKFSYVAKEGQPTASFMVNIDALHRYSSGSGLGTVCTLTSLPYWHWPFVPSKVIRRVDKTGVLVKVPGVSVSNGSGDLPGLLHMLQSDLTTLR